MKIDEIPYIPTPATLDLPTGGFAEILNETEIKTLLGY